MAKHQHAPEAVAHVAATLLSGRHDAEPHHIKAAVATAHAILDAAQLEVEPELEPEAEAAAEDPA